MKVFVYGFREEERVYFEEYYHNLLFLCNIQILFFAQIKIGLYCW